MTSSVKLTVAIILSVALSYNAAAQRTFGDTSWDMSKEEARRWAISEGWSLMEDEHYPFFLFFSGQIAGDPATLDMGFLDNQLAMVAVTINTPDILSFGTYEDMKVVLTRHYGEPDIDAEHYLEPYRDGDGRLYQALREGKAVIGAEWNPADKYDESVFLTITSKLDVAVMYTTREWSKHGDQLLEDEDYGDF